MVTIIVLASACVILFVSLYLAFCENYDDGIIGHVSLGGMALSSAAPLYEAITTPPTEWNVLQTAPLMYAAVSVFMARHTYRFKHYQKTGKGEWRDDDTKAAN